MKEFKSMRKNEIFSMGVWELKPDFENKNLKNDFLNKFSFPAYLNGLTFSFIKIDDKTCVETKTGTKFELEETRMISDETGLSFAGSYVNDKQIKKLASDEYTEKYFETARDITNTNAKKLGKKIGL